MHAGRRRSPTALNENDSLEELANWLTPIAKFCSQKLIMRRFIIFLALCATTFSAPAQDTQYAACQMPQQQGQQLSKCPNGTIYVSQTDPQAGYGQISDAISALPQDLSVSHNALGEILTRGIAPLRSSLSDLANTTMSSTSLDRDPQRFSSVTDAC